MAHFGRRVLVMAVECAADVGEWLQRLWDHVARKTLYTVTRALWIHDSSLRSFHAFSVRRARHLSIKIVKLQLSAQLSANTMGTSCSRRDRAFPTSQQVWLYFITYVTRSGQTHAATSATATSTTKRKGGATRQEGDPVLCGPDGAADSAFRKILFVYGELYEASLGLAARARSGSAEGTA